MRKHGDQDRLVSAVRVPARGATEGQSGKDVRLPMSLILDSAGTHVQWQQGQQVGRWVLWRLAVPVRNGSPALRAHPALRVVGSLRRWAGPLRFHRRTWLAAADSLAIAAQ